MRLLVLLLEGFSPRIYSLVARLRNLGCHLGTGPLVWGACCIKSGVPKIGLENDTSVRKGPSGYR